MVEYNYHLEKNDKELTNPPKFDYTVYEQGVVEPFDKNMITLRYLAI